MGLPIARSSAGELLVERIDHLEDVLRPADDRDGPGARMKRSFRYWRCPSASRRRRASSTWMRTPREELPRGERLHEEVVGAGLEAVDAHLLAPRAESIITATPRGARRPAAP